MIIDCDKYRVNEVYIRTMSKNMTLDERVKGISDMAISTAVPVIVVLCYIIEMYGPDIRYLHLLNKLCDFYKISQIVNCKDTTVALRHNIN